jgi:hypothetical protein
MRAVLLPVLLLLPLSGLARQDVAPTPTARSAAAMTPLAVSLPLPWKEGLEVAYRSKATQDRFRGGTHLVLATHETLRLKVLEVNPGGFLLQWSNEGPTIEASGDAPTLASDKAMASALAARFGQLPYEVELNAKGEFTGLRNWQALSAAMREVMLPVLVAQAKARPELASQTDEALRARFAPVLEKMSGQSVTNASLGREAAIFNFFVGASMAPGEVREYDDLVPSPWSGDAIPTHGRFQLVSVDDEAGTVTIHWTQSIDPVKGRDAVLKSMEALTGKAVPDEVKANLPAAVKLDDEATVELDRASGLPLKLAHTRKVLFGQSSTTNTWTLEKIGK